MEGYVKIYLYSDEIQFIDHWEKILCEYNTCTLYEQIELDNIKDSLIIMNYSTCTTNCTNLISELSYRGNKILLLDRTPNLNIGQKMIGSDAKGYGDAFMRSVYLLSAVETIIDGMVWLYPEYTFQLIQKSKSTHVDVEHEPLGVLSGREKEVALLIKKGLKNSEISDQLSITVRTVRAHASKIYEKLNIKDRLDLIILLTK